MSPDSRVRHVMKGHISAGMRWFDLPTGGIDCEIQETFPEKDRPAYTTIQTTVYRLEAKKAVRRVRKVGNFHIFEAAVTLDAAQRRLIDDLLALFAGSTQPVIAHLIQSGNLTLKDVKVSSPGDFHPEALAEPSVRLSPHSAPIRQTRRSS